MSFTKTSKNIFFLTLFLCLVAVSVSALSISACTLPSKTYRPTDANMVFDVNFSGVQGDANTSLILQNLSDGNKTDYNIFSNSFYFDRNIVISQVYGGSGGAGATYKNDFIELYNQTDSPIDLSTWSVQYSAAAGSSWSKTNLTGTIGPKQYYLINEASGGANGSDNPTGDDSGSIGLSTTTGKVVLVNFQTTVPSTICPVFDSTLKDFIGYGTTANCREGQNGTSSNAPAPSATTADARRPEINNDSNDNSVDFNLITPAPRNKAYQDSARVGNQWTYAPSSSDLLDFFRYTCKVCDTNAGCIAQTYDFNTLNANPTVDANLVVRSFITGSTNEPASYLFSFDGNSQGVQTSAFSHQNRFDTNFSTFLANETPAVGGIRKITHRTLIDGRASGYGVDRNDIVFRDDQNTYTQFLVLNPQDINVVRPNGNAYLSTTNNNADGNQSIDFNIINTDSNYIRLRVYQSSTRGGFQYLLFDYNLTRIATNPTADLNCGASSIAFGTVRQCHLDWNISAPALNHGDGNFYIDLNASYYAFDANWFDSSMTSFMIDLTAPSLSKVTPASNVNTSSTTFSFVYGVSDGTGSFGKTCDYNGYKNNVIIGAQTNQSGVLNSGGTQCSISFTTAVTGGDKIDVNAKVYDYAGLGSQILKSFSYTYGTALDSNIITPNGNNYYSLFQRNADGNLSLDFNVISTSSNYLRLKAYKSSSRLGFENLLIDVNLSQVALAPNADQNCGASSLVFSSTRTCHFDWNAFGPFFTGDGNFYLDINISDYSTSSSLQNSSATAFVIDTNKPYVRWDGNDSVWQKTDSNIHLVCVDVGGCDLSKIFYRLDTDPSSLGSLGANVLFDKNILYRASLADGNFEQDFNAVDLAGNTSDLNVRFVLLDTNPPVISNTFPTASTTTSGTTFVFAGSLNDGYGSNAVSCDYNAYLNNIALSINQSGTVSDGGTVCSVALAFLPQPGDVIDINYNVVDQVGLRSITKKSNSYTYSPSQTGNTGGGGGGSDVIVTQITNDFNLSIPGILSLVPSQQVIALGPGQTTSYSIRATNLTSEPFNVDVELSDSLKTFVVGNSLPQSIAASSTEIYTFTVKAPDVNFNRVDGVLRFAIQGGATHANVALTIKQEQQLDLSFLGSPVVLVVIVIVLLGLAYWAFEG